MYALFSIVAFKRNWNFKEKTCATKHHSFAIRWLFHCTH
jgi:hypothetical protein